MRWLVTPFSRSVQFSGPSPPAAPTRPQIARSSDQKCSSTGGPQEEEEEEARSEEEDMRLGLAVVSWCLVVVTSSPVEDRRREAGGGGGARTAGHRSVQYLVIMTPFRGHRMGMPGIYWNYTAVGSSTVPIPDIPTKLRSFLGMHVQYAAECASVYLAKAVFSCSSCTHAVLWGKKGRKC